MCMGFSLEKRGDGMDNAMRKEINYHYQSHQRVTGSVSLVRIAGCRFANPVVLYMSLMLHGAALRRNSVPCGAVSCIYTYYVTYLHTYISIPRLQ